MPNSTKRVPVARHLAVFAIFLLSLSFSSLGRADQLRYLGESAEALDVLMGEVDGAKASIDLTYFIFNPSSSVAKILLKKLIAKAHAGVRVRLLIDANPHDDMLQMEFTGALHREGIQIKYYRPGNQYNPMNNVRSHAKLALFDGQRYITGGRNIEDDYYGVSDWMNYVDREVWVSGKSARKAQAAFNRLWSEPESVVRTGATEHGMSKMKKDWEKLDKKTRLTERALGRRSLSLQAGNTPVVTCESVQFTFDDPAFVDASNEGSVYDDGAGDYMNGPRLELKETTNAVLSLMYSAKKSLLMENYSYLPTAQLASALARARAKGIPVTIVTNRDVERESYAQFIQREAIAQDNYGTEKILQLSRHGVIRDKWEGPTKKTSFWTIHGKVFVADGESTIVSSFNIDPRSYHTNLETGVIARHCPAFAAIVTEKTRKLERDFELDKTCAKCQQPTRDNGILKSLTGWIAYNFI